MLTTREKVDRLCETGISEKEISLILGIPAEEVQSFLCVPARVENLKELVIRRIEAGQSTQEISRDLRVTSRKVAAHRAHNVYIRRDSVQGNTIRNA